RALTLDLLILALGIAINLMTDYSAHANNNNSNSTSSSAPTLLPLLIDPTDPLSTLFAQLIGVFKSGRARIDRELDSSPPPLAPANEKGHPARSEEASRPEKAGECRERDVSWRRDGEWQGGDGAADGEGGDGVQLGEGEGEGEDGGDGDGAGEGDVGFNIAWGYLAVFLGKCCSFPSSSSSSFASSSSSSEAKAEVGGTEIRQFVAGCLHDDHQDGEARDSGQAVGQQQRQKGKKARRGQGSGGTEGGLDILVQAVEEFVVYHQRVDGMMMNHDRNGSGGGGSTTAKGDMMDEDGMMGGRAKDEEEVFAGQEGKEV
ncbi:hypothetical protein KC336_g22152, partial [Hortaea werneckii]